MRSVELDGGETLEMRVTADADRVTITAIEDGREVGHAWIDLRPLPHADNMGLEVDPTQRSRGIGRRLVDVLLDVAATHDVAWLRCTHANDLATRRMFETANAICSRKVTDGRSRDSIYVPRAA